MRQTVGLIGALCALAPGPGAETCDRRRMYHEQPFMWSRHAAALATPEVRRYILSRPLRGVPRRLAVEEVVLVAEV